jgi:hypothetical protein
MQLFTSFGRRLLPGLGLILGLTAGAAAQSVAPRYVFPDTNLCGLQPLPGGQTLMVTTDAGCRLLRLHWLDAQGDTVRSRRILLRRPSPYPLLKLSRNVATGTILIGMGSDAGSGVAVLLSPQGDSLWTRPANWLRRWTRPVGTPDGGFAYLTAGSTQSVGYPPEWVKIDASGQEVRRTALTTGGPSVGTTLLPAAGGGYWAILLGGQPGPGGAPNRAVFVSEAGSPSGREILLLQRIETGESLPDPADGYVLSTEAGLQRFSAAFVPQWPAAVPGDILMNHAGVRAAADGTVLTYGGLYWANGTYVPPYPFPLQARVVSARGQILQDTVLSRYSGGYAAFGLDIAKTSGGHLVYAAEAVRSASRSVHVYVTSTPLPIVLSATPVTRMPKTSAYPQPAASAVTVRSAAPLRGAALLLDQQGRCVRRFELSAGLAHTLPLDGLPAGLYVLQAIDAAGRPVRVRISKQ